MKKTLHIMAIIGSLILICTFCFISLSLPKKDGSIKIKGLRTSVSVYTDKFGIPHIESTNHLDAYRGLGWIMASERLFQMDLMRRVSKGELSEIFGEKTIKTDKFIRTLLFKSHALKNLEVLKKRSPELIQETEAFLEGVNEYIKNEKLPLEFTFLQYVPEEFTLLDVAIIPYYMGLTFSEGLVGDALFTSLKKKISARKFSLLEKGVDGDHEIFDVALVPEIDTSYILDALKPLEEIIPMFHGSNFWVLGPDRSATGSPILANDPHIGVANPHIFFEAHLKTPKVDLYGNFLPLVPFATLGNTPKFAWGFTMSEVDDINIYSEKFNPENSNEIKYKNEWIKIKKWKEVIKVKDSFVHEITVGLTPHGPLIDAGKSSLSWSMYHPQNFALQTLRELAYSSDINNLRTAVSHGAAPGLNIGWAHKEGDIAWWVHGKIPKLPKGVKTDRVLPGWDGSAEIESYLTIDQNPHEVNPLSNLIVSANYKPEGKQYEEIDGYWQPGDRFYRLKYLLEKKKIWSVNDMKLLQVDTKLHNFKKERKDFFNLMDIDKLSIREKQIWSLLQNWDGDVIKESVGASIYYVLKSYLTEFVLDEISKKDFDKFVKIADFDHLLKNLMFQPNHNFWDIRATDRVEYAKDILLISFRETTKYLSSKYGVDSKRWNWGRLHRYKAIHPLGRVKPLNLIFNQNVNGIDGGKGVVNLTSFKRGGRDFSVNYAPASRRILDLGNPNNNLSIFPTGNSGHPFSSNFSDQLNLYQNGEYRSQLQDWNKIKRLKKLTLLPLL